MCCAHTIRSCYKISERGIMRCFIFTVFKMVWVTLFYTVLLKPFASMQLISYLILSSSDLPVKMFLNVVFSRSSSPCSLCLL